MNTPENRIRILALLCDAQGLVQRVLADDWGVSARLEPGRAWTDLVAPSDLGEALAFWRTLLAQKAVSAWELAVPLGEGVLRLQFSAGMSGEAVTLVAAWPGAEPARIDAAWPGVEPARIDAARPGVEPARIDAAWPGAEPARIDAAWPGAEPARTGAPAAPAQGWLDEQASRSAAGGAAVGAGPAGLEEEPGDLRRELARRDDELRQAQRLLEQVFAVTPNAIYLLDLERQLVLQSNPALPRLLGLEADALPGMRGELFMDRLHPQDRPEYTAYLRRRNTLAAGEMIEHEHRILRPDGSTAWLHCREEIFAVDAQGQPTHVLGVAEDVTRLRQAQEHLLLQPYTDSLTGLGNRAFMEAELQRLQAAASSPVSVLAAGLQGLEEANQRLGQAAGDEMLRRAGQVLQSALRAGESIARTGGDEFVVILPNTSRSAVIGIIRRIRRSLAHYNAGHAGDLPLSLGLGVATAQPGELLSIALQLAGRRMGRNRARHKAPRKTE